jgi:hypothetical protein
MEAMKGFDRPRAGFYYTSVITNGNSWCKQPGIAGRPRAGGVARPTCDDALATGGDAISYAFDCGRDPHRCATVIAQEHAHTVGLVHSGSPTDLLYPVGCSRSECRFEDRDTPVLVLQGPEGACGRSTQNSYRMMLDRLGPRRDRR